MSDEVTSTEDATCEECGAHLSEAELQIVLNRGGPVLCSEHIADIVEQDEDSLGAKTEL